MTQFYVGPKRSKFSLFGTLNRCGTSAGVRLLRSNLYQPPVDPGLINDRIVRVLESILLLVRQFSKKINKDSFETNKNLEHTYL